MAQWSDLPAAAERRCLGQGCGKLFPSSGPENRKCPACTTRDAGLSRREAQAIGRLAVEPPKALGAADPTIADLL